VPETIEADVLEINGSPPPAPREPEPEPVWQGMKARVLRLDRRWWPLWVIVGTMALALLAVGGVIFAMFLIAARMLAIVLRFFTGSRSPRAASGLARSLR
jgi:hypothetical protein